MPVEIMNCTAKYVQHLEFLNFDINKYCTIIENHSAFTESIRTLFKDGHLDNLSPCDISLQKYDE